MRDCPACHPQAGCRDSACKEATPTQAGGRGPVPLCPLQGDSVLMTVPLDPVAPDISSLTHASLLQGPENEEKLET